MDGFVKVTGRGEAAVEAEELGQKINQEMWHCN